MERASVNEPNSGGEQWHAHQGLGRPVFVDSFVFSSPWVMPGVLKSKTQHAVGLKSRL